LYFQGTLFGSGEKEEAYSSPQRPQVCVRLGGDRGHPGEAAHDWRKGPGGEPPGEGIFCLLLLIAQLLLFQFFQSSQWRSYWEG